jgi:Family of unknown function (DUF5990)
MAELAPGIRSVQIRLISEAAPPKEYQNRPTEFGLPDKKQQQFDRGRIHPDGSVQFDLEVEVQRIGPTGTLRFRGPCVQGTPAEPFLYLAWNYADEPKAIRRQKIPLYTIPGKMIDQAERDRRCILQTKVLPITERTGTVPVEWTVR